MTNDTNTGPENDRRHASPDAARGGLATERTDAPDDGGDRAERPTAGESRGWVR